MKNIIMQRISVFLLFVLGCTVTLDAEVLKLRATSYAYKTYSEVTGWSDWSDWELSRDLVVFGDNYRVTIYSTNPQEFDFVNALSEDEYDDEGGKTTTWLMVDQDGQRCHMRLRNLSDGGFQLYIDYTNIMYVYMFE